MPEKASNSLNCLRNSKLHVLILYNLAFSHNYHALLAGRAHGVISTQAVFLFVYCPVYSLYRFVKELLAEPCFKYTILHPLSKVQKHLCHFSLSHKVGHINFELFVCFVCFVVRNNLHIPGQAGIPRGVVMNHHHRADLPRNHAIYKGLEIAVYGRPKSYITLFIWIPAPEAATTTGTKAVTTGLIPHKRPSCMVIWSKK